MSRISCSLACFMSRAGRSHHLLKSAITFFLCNTSSLCHQQVSSRHCDFNSVTVCGVDKSSAAECTAQTTVQTTQDELVNIIYMAEATQRPALHNNDKALRAQHTSAYCNTTYHEGLITIKKKNLMMQLDFTNVNIGDISRALKGLKNLSRSQATTNPVGLHNIIWKDRAFPGNTGMFC